MPSSSPPSGTPSDLPATWMKSPAVWLAIGLSGFALVGGVVLLMVPSSDAPSDAEVESDAAPAAPSAEGAPTAVASPATVTPAVAPAAEPAAPSTPPASNPRSPRKPTARPAPAAPAEKPLLAVPNRSSTLQLRAVGKSSAAGVASAKVYVDGKAVGTAPVDYKVDPGTRRVRFDCVFEGKTYRGKDQVIDLPPDTDAVIEHTCDVWVTLR